MTAESFYDYSNVTEKTQLTPVGDCTYIWVIQNTTGGAEHTPLFARVTGK
jgi:hypothetical protein